VIEYADFTKDYDGHRAVDSLSLQLPRGTVVALLGPNGSGKTTTIKAAAGLLRPTAGTVRVGEPGLDPLDPEARRRCSFLPQRVSFPDALSGREIVEFYRRLRGADAEATERVLKFSALNGSSGRAVRTYSGGMLQRLGLAVAMLPKADILLLDEPTAALDADGLCALYELIDERRRAGASILFSSHQLGDIERLADHVAVLAEGRMVAWVSECELARHLADRGVMRVRLRAHVPGVLERIKQVAPDASWFHDELIVPGPAAGRPLALDSIREAGGEISGLTAEDGRLDDLYRELLEARQ